MKGRFVGIITIILTFLAGITLGYLSENYSIKISPYILTTSIALFLYSFIHKNSTNNYYTVYILYIVVLLLGITHYTTQGCGSTKGYFNSHSQSKEQVIADSVKEFIEREIKEIAPEKEEYSILLAIVLGNKTELSSNQKRAYSSSGAMHILALSGLHIGILYSILQTILFLLNFTHITRRVKLWVIFAFLLFYAYITGFSASVQRAVIMIVIYHFVKLGDRQYNRAQVLAIAAFIIVLISAKELFNIGFQLSFAAILGIIYLFPTISQAISGNGNKRGILKRVKEYLFNTIALSTACQISTLPFVLYYFGSSSNYFLLSNIAAIPLATLLLHNFIMALCFKSVPFMGEILSRVVVINIELLNRVVEILS